jgi:hypothetical protein
MRICPLCNGFIPTLASCPRCGGRLNDQGRIADFYDDYSPYLERDLPGAEGGKCRHLLCCPYCFLEQEHEVPYLDNRATIPHNPASEPRVDS